MNMMYEKSSLSPLFQAGITPPNTNTKNGSVPGGLYDRQNALKQLADSLKQLIK